MSATEVESSDTLYEISIRHEYQRLQMIFSVIGREGVNEIFMS